MKRLSVVTLTDPAAERVRQDMTVAILELQLAPLAATRIVKDIELAEGIATPVPHGLNRPAIYVRESCPRNAVSTGRIVESRTGSHDRNKYVVLTATGWGATITVDVLVA